MNYKRLLLMVPLLAAAFFFTTSGIYYGSRVNAQETKTGTTGYATGTRCPKTGTYRASNRHLEIVLVVKQGALFPTFSDGSKTIWYPLKDS